MRAVCVALAATGLLWACGATSDEAAETSSYRADVRASPGGAPSETFTIYVDGADRRFERRGADGGVSVIVTRGDAGGFALSIRDGRTFAVTFPGPPPPDPMALEAPPASQETPSGPRCSAAGETGRLSVAGDARACVGRGGVLLFAEKAGVREWEVVSISRGPVDPSLFAIPPDAEIMSAEAIADAPTSPKN